MTVKQLIKTLEDFNQDAIVLLANNLEWEVLYNKIEVSENAEAEIIIHKAYTEGEK